MSARVVHITSANNTNPIQIGSADAILVGVEIYNTAAAARFVKFFWGAPGTFGSNAQKPAVGTDAPALTIGLATVTNVGRWFGSDGLRNTGNLWVAVSTGAADSDNTAGAAGDIIMSVFYR